MPKNESEITIEIGNLPGISARSDALKSYTGEDGEVATPVPGEREMLSMFSCFNYKSNINKNENIYLALNFKLLGYKRCHLKV